MKPCSNLCGIILLFLASFLQLSTHCLDAGIAVRDITPDGPIWLAGYASRNKPSEKVDHPLLVQALAFRDAGQRVVLVPLDNCEVSREFTAPVLQQLEQKHGLARGSIMIISSHTHSGPVLQSSLDTMYELSPLDQERLAKYGRKLQEIIVEVVDGALADLRPAVLEHGVGRTTFAMNRRIYKEDQVNFGDNLDGPVDWDVPVLRIKNPDNTIRGILFGYACHGTSIRTGPDFYTVSGDYMTYARHQLEAVYPGATAMYVTGMGADSDPSPRGGILEARRHGLALAGAVAGVLSRPMRRVDGTIRLAVKDAELPLADPPTREQLEKDAQSQDRFIKKRAQGYLARLDKNQPLPTTLNLPLSVIRLGDSLTFVAMGGEVVVDYATRFKRLFAEDHPWLIGYAYEVPCYIPSARIIKEGGYEAQFSLIYYGLYGPFRGKTEQILIESMSDLVKRAREAK